VAGSPWKHGCCESFNGKRVFSARSGKLRSPSSIGVGITPEFARAQCAWSLPASARETNADLGAAKLGMAGNGGFD